MKTFLYLIFNIYFAKSLLIKEEEKDGKIKNQEEPEIVLIYEGSLENKKFIEIKPNYIITQINWTKKEDYSLNYLLGVFEGSKENSFIDGIPIGIIKPKGELNKINNLEINTSETFKYIRYIPPNRNLTDISPIKIYGYQYNSIFAQSHKNFQVTNLPLISIHTENSF